MTTITFQAFKLKYQFDCQLSQGSFGRVCRIQEIQSKKYFALKKVAVKKKQQLQDIQNEIQLLQRFKHPFVVQIIETYKIQIKSGFAKPFWEVGLVMQLAKCSLEHVIRMRKTIGTFQFIIEQISGLIKILYILQKQNIAHRDIKPANILVFQNLDNSCRWKLADFGLAVNLNQPRQEDSFAGSFQYASPILKRKFKYPNLKIKSNPFKDDVYSMGISLLEILTGFRTYNTQSYNKLRQICQDKRLIQLTQMMLQQDEQKRPCFKQLIMVLQKDFNIPQIFQPQNTSISQTNKTQQKLHTKYKQTQKYAYKNYLIKQQQQQISLQQNKTVLKINNNQQINQNLSVFRNIRKNIVNVGRPIQCLASLDGIVMCGCDNGEILFVKDGQVIISKVKIHQRYITHLVDDRKGNIWSVGGDNTIKIFHKTTLIKALLSQVTVIKSQYSQRQRLELELKPSCYKTLTLPYTHQGGISCLTYIDQNNFAVGFFDGYIYIKWEQSYGELHQRMFRGPVTDIKIQGKDKPHFKKIKGRKMWVCGMEGMVKMINLIYVKPGSNFTNIFLHQSNSPEIQPSLNILTLDGRQQILSHNLDPLYETSLSKSTQILSTLEIQVTSNNQIQKQQNQYPLNSYTNKNYFMLTVNGEIVDSNEQKIAQLGGKGWNCIVNGGPCQIIAGSFMGQIAILQWS